MFSGGMTTQKVLGPSQALSSSTSQQQSLFQQQQLQMQHQQQLEQQRLYQEKLLQEQKHGEEIKQESLKSTLQSAITDIEEQIDGADFEADKENLYPVHKQVGKSKLKGVVDFYLNHLLCFKTKLINLS